MLTTRADPLPDVVLAVTLVAPWFTALAIRRARERRWRSHRILQVGLLTVCVLAVLALEWRIRQAGGSGALLASSPLGRHVFARVLLDVHIGVAVLTYIVWGWLAVVSTRRFDTTLPGAFSGRHRFLGWCIFSGLVFTSMSALGVYWVTFMA